MSRGSQGGKALSGGSALNARSLSGLEDSILAAISGGGVVFNNITITGGIIDGTVIGENLPGPSYFTSLQVGKPDGTGGQACFFGNTVGDYACWRNTTGLWDIGGDLSVRDISDLGNIRVSANSISSTNTNGNINISSNGNGILNVSGGGIAQTTTNGNIIFNSTNGNYTLASKYITTGSSRNTKNTTTNGSITLQTGTGITSNTITFITTGASPVVTTSTVHNLIVGDKVTITGSNSTPTIDNTYTVTAVNSTVSFTISANPSVVSSGNSGTVTLRNDINLDPNGSVFITQNKRLVFGDDLVNIYGDVSGNMNINSSDSIILTPTTNVSIPNDVPLIFGSTTRNIQSDGTDLVLNTDNKVVVNGDFQVNGNSSIIETTVTTLTDPVITLGGTSPPIVSDTADRGVEYHYHNGVSAKIGFFGKKTSTGCFTYIPDATNTNEVFTGALGCIEVGSISATSLNLNGGSITNSGTLNACNLFCSSNMSISATSSITMTTPTTTINTELTITDSVPIIGSTGISDTTDKGFIFNYYDSGAKQGFFGWDSSTNCFKFLKDITSSSNTITSGTAGNMCLGNTIISDLTVTGDSTVNNLTVTGTLTAGSTSPPEHISVAGGANLNPTFNVQVTFITITSVGNSTGTLLAPTSDGFVKKIVLVSAPSNSTYVLTCPAGLLVDPGSETSGAKFLTFKNVGQSIELIWNNILSCYFIVNAGVCIS